MRASDCNVMLRSVSLTTSRETNRQVNHYHTVDLFLFFVFFSLSLPLLEHRDRLPKCKQTSLTHHAPICVAVSVTQGRCRLNYYYTGCFHSSGHDEALWGIYHYLGVTPIE